MKKLLMAFALTIATVVTVHAQYNGDVYVINDTDCEIAINVHARCPDCSDYHSNMMTIIPAHTGFPGMRIYDATLPAPNPYFNPTDPSTVCDDWKWSYADVTYFCGGNAYNVQVGDPGDPCNVGITDKLPAASACSGCYEGRPVNVRWNRIQDIYNSTAITFGY